MTSSSFSLFSTATKEPLLFELFLFPNGEGGVKIQQNVPREVTVLWNVQKEMVHTSTMEYLLLMDALWRKGARDVTLVLPYLPYSRQDRTTANCDCLSAKVFANTVCVPPVQKIISFDIHSSQLEGFYSCSLEKRTLTPLLVSFLQQKYASFLASCCVVAPDMGAVALARMLGDTIGCDVCCLEKQRDPVSGVKVMQLRGDVKGKNCIMIDDMIDTGGTIMKGLGVLRDAGCNHVLICAIHGIFSGEANKKFSDAFADGLFNRIIVTNTVQQEEYGWKEVVDMQKEVGV